MDFTVSTSSASSSTAQDGISQGEHYLLSVEEERETICWGCGIRLLVSPYEPVFKCGWCGAITNKNSVECENKYYMWRRLRDRCCVGVLTLFMLFIICGGIWAIYPIVFSISLFSCIFHSIIIGILSISTLCTFGLAAFRSPGAPPRIEWGSYPAVGKDGLENYTFCMYCSKPKSPRAHHCRSCGMCIFDMDHHCPFIGNCVGAANHRSFILFLISTVTSMFYVSLMSVYSALHIWPPIDYRTIRYKDGLNTYELDLTILKEATLSFLGSAVFISPRGIVLVYLFIASVAVQIGLSVLLWQQLCFIYQGKTYLSNLTSSLNEEPVERDCQNFAHFFGCQCTASRYFPNFWNSRKSHEK